MTTFTITGTNPITVRNPKYGYDVEIVMDLNISETTAGPKLFDNGVGTDYRVCREIMHLLPKTDAAALSAFLRDPAEARNYEVQLDLTAGFFPGGPDWGDVGEFDASFIAYEPGGMMTAPWKHFELGADMVITDHPAYTAPAQRREGPMQFGAIHGLPYPEIKPTSSYAVLHDLTLSGAPYSVDSGRRGDRWYSDVSVSCNHGNAGALITYLAGTARATDWDIVAPEDYHLFGIDCGSSGTYTVRFADNKIKVRHYRYDSFTVSFRLYMVSYTVDGEVITHGDSDAMVYEDDVVVYPYA